MAINFELGKVHSNPFVRAFKPQSIAEANEDHEVKMAQGQLDYIIKAATELKEKLGNDEKQIPGWIQDHISKAHSYIHQSNSGYHEYGNEEYVSESVNPKDIANQLDKVKSDLMKRVTVLVDKKKKLYSNVDITTPLSDDEKQLDRDISDLFSQINNIVSQKRKVKTESIELKEMTNLTEQNPSFNKWLLKFVDEYISGGEFTKGSPQFQWALATLLSATLTDANFHKAAKKAKNVFRRAEEPNNSDNIEKLLNNKASEVAKKSKWDGDDIIDGFAYVAAMTIGGGVMGSIVALKTESVKSSTKLISLIGKNK